MRTTAGKVKKTPTDRRAKRPTRSASGTKKAAARARSSRIEVRATPQDRALLERAADASGTDLTGFVLRHTTEAARRVLADQTEFVLSAEQWKTWEAMNRRPARALPDLRRLLDRPPPFEA